MIVERLNRPTTGAVSVDRAAAHCRVDGNESDAELGEMIAAATRELEDYSGLALLDQTIRVTLECWSRASVFPLPIAPVLDVLPVSITADGAPYEDFAVITGQRPAIRIAGDRPSGVVVIEYEAGFGATENDIPDDIRMAIVGQVANLYERRGDDDAAKGTGMAPQFARIAARYRRVAL